MDDHKTIKGLEDMALVFVSFGDKRYNPWLIGANHSLVHQTVTDMLYLSGPKVEGSQHTCQM